MTEDELMEVHRTVELAKAESTRAYEFGASAYTFAAFTACQAASRVVTAAVKRLEVAKAATVAASEPVTLESHVDDAPKRRLLI